MGLKMGMESGDGKAVLGKWGWEVVSGMALGNGIRDGSIAYPFLIVLDMQRKTVPYCILPPRNKRPGF